MPDTCLISFERLSCANNSTICLQSSRVCKGNIWSNLYADLSDISEELGFQENIGTRVEYEVEDSDCCVDTDRVS